MPRRRTKQKRVQFPVDQSVYQIRLPRITEPLEERAGVGPFRIYPGADDTAYLSEMSLTSLRKVIPTIEVVREFRASESGVGIRFPVEMVLHEYPPADVMAEIVALAVSRRDRGKDCGPVYCGRTREDTLDTFILDRPGGVRNYRWHWEKRVKQASAETIVDRFPKLRSLMTDRDTRFVVSLGGGGLLLFAHPSIFKLIEAMHAHDHIAEIWGCSGGALAGMAYALGADHEIIEKEGYDIYNRRYNMELAPSKMEVVKNLLLNQFLPGSAVSLEGFVDVQTSIQQSLGRVARERRPRIPAFALAYNIDTKRSEALTPIDVRGESYRGFIRRCSPLQSVLASSAIPVLFTPCSVSFGKKRYTYIDGSIGEEVPLMSIYRKWRIDRANRTCRAKKLFVLAVNLFPYLSTQRYFGDFFVRYLPILQTATVVMRIVDLVRRVHVDDDLRYINADPHARVVEVRLPKLSRYNILNPEIIPIVIERARGTFYHQLEEIEKTL